jgi:hypothetical protein
MTKEFNYVVTATIDNGKVAFALDLDRTDVYFEDAYTYDVPDLELFPEEAPEIRPLRLEEIPTYEAIADRICNTMTALQMEIGQ